MEASELARIEVVWWTSQEPGGKHWRDASGTNVTEVGCFWCKLVAGVQSVRLIVCSVAFDSATRSPGE